MYSFSSASQICDPLPRTINGGSPPTEPNARTGEFTPPGIMLSARCCKRRDSSTFRLIVDGIVAPTTEECQSTGLTTIAAPTARPAQNKLIVYSRFRHHFATSCL